MLLIKKNINKDEIGFNGTLALPWSAFMKQKANSTQFSSKCQPNYLRLADGRRVESFRLSTLVDLEIIAEDKSEVSIPERLSLISAFAGGEESILGLLGLELLNFQFSKDLKNLLYMENAEDCIGPASRAYE